MAMQEVGSMSLSAMGVRVCLHQLGLLLACGMVAMTAGALAQDTRTVTEPKIPATCVKLQATQFYVDGVMDPAEETQENTADIQAAIDGFAAKCQPGQGVELAMG